jgi:hypothetical protein
MTDTNDTNDTNNTDNRELPKLVGFFKNILFKLMSKGVEVPLETVIEVDNIVSNPEFALSEEEQAEIADKVNNISLDVSETMEVTEATETLEASEANKSGAAKAKTKPVKFPRARNTVKWFATAQKLTTGSNYRYEVKGSDDIGYMLHDNFNSEPIAFRSDKLKLVNGGYLKTTSASGVRDKYGRIQEQAMLEEYGFMVSPIELTYKNLKGLDILIYVPPVVSSHVVPNGAVYMTHTITRFAPCVWRQIPCVISYTEDIEYKMVIYASDTQSAYSVQLYDRRKVEKILESDISDTEKLQQLLGTLDLPFEAKVTGAEIAEGAPGRWYKYNKSNDKCKDKNNTKLVNIGETSSSKDLFNPTKE